jgi:hypothetical protein
MRSSRQLFTPEEVERARRQHRPLYIALLVDTTLGLVTLSLLAFTHLSEVPAEERLIARGNGASRRSLVRARHRPLSTMRFLRTQARPRRPCCQ